MKFRHPEEVNILEDQLRELETEFGIHEKDLRGRPTLTGISYHPNTGETDASAIERVNLDDEYFLSGHWRKVPHPEHGPQLVQLRGLDEIGELLSTGKSPGSNRTYPILYSTRQALESIRAEDIKPL